jgi:uncharacterized membrane protein YphA (DoxX/SURF4 family)
MVATACFASGAVNSPIPRPLHGAGRIRQCGGLERHRGEVQSRRTPAAEASTAGFRDSPISDLALRWAAIALILAGAAILIGGLSQPVAIALIALGLLPRVLRQSSGHGPRRA